MSHHILGFTMSGKQKKGKAKRQLPQAIGIYDALTKEEKGSPTLELRVYRPGHIIRGVFLSNELKQLRQVLEVAFGIGLSDYLQKIDVLQNDYQVERLPRLGKGFRTWEPNSTIKYAVTDSTYNVHSQGMDIVNACKLSPNPYLEFDRIAVLLAVASRLRVLSDICALLSADGILTFHDIESGNTHSVQVEKPRTTRFYLIHVEEIPGFYLFPFSDSVAALSNALLSEYYRFHYSLRKALVMKTGRLLVGDNLVPVAETENYQNYVHRQASKIFVLKVLSSLGVYRSEGAYQYASCPTSLLKTLASYASTKCGYRPTVQEFCNIMRDEFRIIVHPNDVAEVGLSCSPTERLGILAQSNYDRFVQRLVAADIAEIRPDGEATLK